MRGTIPDLRSPRPFADELPAPYRQAETSVVSLVERFVTGLDGVIAPVFATLDNLPAYLDPWLAPADFVDYLAGWVAAAPDETWPLERRRALVAHALRMHALRGTAAGLAEQIRTYTGIEPEIDESGGVSWSTTPESPLPGEAQPRVTVRVRAPAGASVDVRRVRALVESVRPAHVHAEVEVLSAEEVLA
jgi:phage tail-like protein